MNKPFPARCVECKWSKNFPQSLYSLKCQNPVVNANDPWALSSEGLVAGTDCRGERERRWFAPCGIKGKLWEPQASPSERTEP